MRLAFAGVSVSLSLSGYQYPNFEPPFTDRDWDADWLVVSGTFQSNRRTWEFHAPCLTAPEADELCRWLRAIAPSGGGQERWIVTSLDFTEPELAFECELQSDEEAVIRVVLSGRAAHPGGGGGDEVEEASVVTVRMSLVDIGLAADDWERECALYPARSSDATPES
ncbi:hypothetical protein GCM10027406_18940 [Leifsonia lichenia]